MSLSKFMLYEVVLPLIAFVVLGLVVYKIYAGC